MARRQGEAVKDRANEMESKTDRIIRLIEDGSTAKETAERVGCHLQLVYGVARRYKLEVPKKSWSKCEKYSELIKNMRQRGMTSREIAGVLGVSAENVKYYCKRNGIASTERAKHPNRHSDQEAKQMIEAAAPNLEYIGGYTSKEELVTVRCKDCGTVFERRFDGIVFKNQHGCPECKRKQKQARRLEKAEARRQKEKDRRHKAEARQEQIALTFNVCPVCGKLTLRPKYCSDKCRSQAENKTRDARRRAKIKAAMVDRDITLAGLFRRDGGVCQLCGKPCRLDDYVIQRGQKQCGDWYPSIDHIIPLAKGGRHSWENVQLAHRICNSRKRDSMK